MAKTEIILGEHEITLEPMVFVARCYGQYLQAFLTNDDIKKYKYITLLNNTDAQAYGLPSDSATMSSATLYCSDGTVAATLSDSSDTDISSLNLVGSYSYTQDTVSSWTRCVIKLHN